MKGHAEVAGGGFAGLTAAIALACRGWSVAVHERAPAARSEGYGIAVHENGIRVLEALGVADVLVTAMRVAELVTLDARGCVKARMPVKGRTYRVSRNRLVAALAARANTLGVELIFGSAPTGVDAGGVLRFADGAQRKADLVIAADGINSALRASLGVRADRHLLSDGALRLVIPRIADERTSAGDADASAFEHWSGTRRLIYNACSPEEAYIAMSCLARDRAGQRVPIDVQSWRSSFPHLAPIFAEIERLDLATPIIWQHFQVVRLDRWSLGHVAIIGDAAHAMPPNLGQGAGCAMMNALALAEHLATASNLAAGLAAWERTERPLTEHTQRWSGRYSRLTAWPDLVRSAAFALAARVGPIRRALGRTATHVPTGCIPA